LIPYNYTEDFRAEKMYKQLRTQTLYICYKSYILILTEILHKVDNVYILHN